MSSPFRVCNGANLVQVRLTSPPVSQTVSVAAAQNVCQQWQRRPGRVFEGN